MNANIFLMKVENFFLFYPLLKNLTNYFERNKELIIIFNDYDCKIRDNQGNRENFWRYMRMMDVGRS